MPPHGTESIDLRQGKALVKTWHLSAYDSRHLRRGGLSWQQNWDTVLGIVRMLDTVTTSRSPETTSLPEPSAEAFARYRLGAVG
jgi:hypothetical protein